MTPPKRRARLARMVRRLLALVMVLTLLVLLWLHTGWGRDYVRDSITEGTNDAIPGSLEIKELEGSVLGTPTLREISLQGPEGGEILNIKQLDVDMSLADLLADQINLADLQIHGLQLNLRQDAEGNLNLLESLIDPNRKEEGEAWSVALENIEVHGGTIQYSGRNGTSIKLEDIQLRETSVHVDGDTTSLRIGSIDATIGLCGGLPLHASGSIEISSEGISSKKLELRSGDSHAVVEGLKYSQGAQRLEAVVAGSAAPKLLQCFVPQQQWLQALAFSAHVLRPAGAPQMSFGLTINDGMLELQGGTVAADLSSGQGTLAIKELRPNKLVAMEIATFAEGSLKLGFKGASSADMEVHLSGALAVAADGYQVQVPTLEIHNKGKKARAEVTAKAYGSTLKGSALIDWAGAEVFVVESSLTATVPDLSSLPTTLDLAGAGELVEASATGPVTALKLVGTARGQNLRFDESRAKTAAVAFRFDDLPSKLTGRVEAKLSALRHGRERIGPVHAEIESDAEGKVFDLSLRAGQAQRIYANLAAQAHVGQNKTEIFLKRARLRHKSLSAQLRTGAQVQPKLTLWSDGDVTVEEVRLGLGRGSIAVEGSLRRDLNAKLRGIELAPFLPLMPSIDVPLSGSFGGNATIRMTDQGVNASASLKMPALRLSEGGEALDLNFVGKFSPQEIGAAVELQSLDKGGVRFDANMRPPKGNWAHGASRLLRASKIEFEDFDLTLLHPLHPELQTLAGLLDGSLQFGAGVKRIDGELRASNVVHKLWASKRDAALEIHATQKRASVQLDASDSKVGALTLTLDLRPPGPLHSPWRWPLSLAGVVHDSDLKFRKINVVELVDAVPALQATNLRIGGGIVSGTVEFREQGRLIRLQSTATELRVAGRPKISANLLSTFTPDKATMDWEVKLDAANKLRGSGQIDTGITILKDHKHLDRLFARIQKARVQADVSLQASSPKRLATMAGLKQQFDAQGKVDATAKFDGSIEKPGGSADITIAVAQIEGVPIEKVTIHGELEGRDASGTLRVYQDKNRFLRAKADVDVDKLEMRHGEVEAKEIDLRILRVLDKGQGSPLAAIAGVANGTINLTGNLSDITPKGSMRIRKGAIDLGGSLMPLVGISIEIKAAKRRLTLSGKASSGSGRIALSGQAKVVPGGIEDFGLRVRSTRLPVVIANLVCSVDLDSHSQISWKPGLLDIKTNIDSGIVRIPIRSFLGKTRQLHSIDGMSDLVYISPKTGNDKPADIESGSKVRIQIRAKESVIVKTRELLAKVDLDLDTTLVNGTLITLGGARVVSGHVDLFERRYNIDKASAKFHARVPMNPSFNLRLSHDFDQLSLSILAQGSMDKPSLSFVADPSNYDQATLLAIVLGQAPVEDESQEGLHDNALTTISTLAANQLQELLAPVLPFAPDVMRVEKTDNDGELYITGHWINDDWFVAYHHRTLAEDLENTNEAESKYRLSKAWSVEAVLGDSQAGGIDVLWTKRWGK